MWCEVKKQQGCSAIYGDYTLCLTYFWALQPFGVEGVAFFHLEYIFQATSKLGTRCLSCVKGGDNGNTRSK